jgi:hypothetical protein
VRQWSLKTAPIDIRIGYGVEKVYKIQREFNVNNRARGVDKRQHEENARVVLQGLAENIF